MTREPWTCPTCKRTITAVGPYLAVFGEGAHDEAIHTAYRKKWNRVIWGGLGLVALGQVLMVISLIIEALT